MHERYHLYPGLRSKDSHITHNSVRRCVTLREQIYRAIQRCGSFGATAIECAETLSLCHDIVQRHIAGLSTLGRIMDSGDRRITLTYGDYAVVWVVSSYPYSPISEVLYGKEKIIHPTI